MQHPTAPPCRPVRRTDHHPGGDPQRHLPGHAIGPAAPSGGGEAASEAEHGEVGRGWSGEISLPPFDLLLTRRTLRGLQTQPAEWAWVRICSLTSRMSLVRNRHRASPQEEVRDRTRTAKCSFSLWLRPGFKAVQLGQAGLLKEVPIRLNRLSPYSRLGTTSRYATGRHGPLRDHQHSRGVRPILCAGSPPTPSLA
jgi:hypothetical protein